jgi:hypothetical protein
MDQSTILGQVLCTLDSTGQVQIQATCPAGLAIAMLEAARQWAVGQAVQEAVQGAAASRLVAPTLVPIRR